MINYELVLDNTTKPYTRKSLLSHIYGDSPLYNRNCLKKYGKLFFSTDHYDYGG